jgi:chromosome partitioning protein
MEPPVPDARIIVIGNEKGGAGKSTVLVHLAAALMHDGVKLAVIDLDARQQSTGHFFASRAAWAAANPAAELPMPVLVEVGASGDANEAIDRAMASGATVVMIDTPGADTEASRIAHGRADLIVTPMNDSFVDFDMLGHVDAVTLELTKPSLYSETVWEARKMRMVNDRQSIDWVVLRNRLAATEARNRKRLEERMTALSRKVGFRTGPGLRDRVIYRELFPFGLTIADLSATIRPVAVSLAHVAARQELRALMTSLNLGSGTVAPEVRLALAS